MNMQVRQRSQFSPQSVARLQVKLDKCQEFTPVEKLMVYQALSRHWRRHLSKTQFQVLSYIVDRTTGWGKPKFDATAANILHGTDEYSGVGVTRSTYYRTLNELEELGAIWRRSTRDKTRIWIKLDWC